MDLKEELGKKIKTINLRIRNLLIDMNTSEDICIAEYQKRLIAEGCLKKPELILSNDKRIGIKKITVYKSKEEYEEIIRNNSYFKKLDEGKMATIEFKHHKNTRGNSANIEAVLGEAILRMKDAEKYLNSGKLVSCFNSFLSSVEAFGSANGRFRSKVSKRAEKKAQNSEILEEIKSIRGTNKSIKPTEAARRALKRLGYSKNKLSRARRLK